ncbi:hypothetical protein F441_19825 [Phytophthora nicotianae CJ01A1]|uniref:Uncharacterized protein n=6 Tax=Phytophthora nicotianae TaxID=4792 RepID=W2PKD3_PHYN3|nr:hypothetical protein PPTG_17901 [Phytophthora nicotianae INRA-310]ETI33353.1 hypothetical protein F443_19968 [Phytophthora nicotianae P1569]ETK73689.1 hypothetical protein L915_19414 [Phytophthora nicotianae]ETO62110.1 hypothetical protein F444_19958 [Phytophthora nicotianae P1976]ETP03194.1 hypothetical protein F441_19825 [Phytophthora nicotianae CJ01A1]ETP31368.1 hypothetical protein F442_19770 [Phytophthora nicotianae P10297]KUF83854.1 hypothetical protein AM587_10009291 [Phytophthora n
MPFGRRCFALLAPLLLASAVQAKNYFNQSAGYVIEISTDDWSNYDKNGGCVTCPYTCIAPTESYDGSTINASNTTMTASLPSIYTQVKSNGCCYSSTSTTQPSCSTEASPSTAENCGFLYGPTLEWRINNALKPLSDSMTAILFASTDCETFWAVGKQDIRYTSNTKSIKGSKMIQSGCYGDPSGTPMILSGCLTSQLTYSKTKTYTWKNLAEKCEGLAGRCVITNAVWEKHLECCTSRTGLASDWDTTFETYTKTASKTTTLSGAAITAIVIGGVALLMCLIHFGAKVRERARQTALMREQEATDDYEEIMTPLTAGEKQPVALQRPIGPASLEVSLHEGDQIYRKKEDEVLFEGDMY